MKEQIFDIISESGVPVTPKALSEQLEAPLEIVQAALDDLCRDGRVAATRRGGYALPGRIGLAAARIAFQRNGTPVARPIDGSEAFPVAFEGALRGMPDDLVLARCEGERPVVTALLRRGHDAFPAYVRVERRGQGRAQRRGEAKTVCSAVPCDPRIPYDVVLTGDTSGLDNDAIALLRIDRYPEKNRPIYASVLRVLGDAGELHALMRAVAESNGFATEADDDVRAEADAMPDGLRPSDLAGRDDLRDLLTFTIDGTTAKDFDDAVSIQKIDGGWRLGVHIADVSHYVRPGSAIDADARSRGTSLYLPGLTVPMLPERLSNDLCSLMPGVDRLAMSLTMDVVGGSVVDHRLSRSVIHSHARLTYEAVNRLYDGAEADISPEIASALLEMRALSRLLRQKRAARGAIDFDTEEPEFVLDERGEPVDILCQPRGEAERVIEDFMLAANETVAALARDAELPFVYRVHESPDPERLRALEAFLGTLNLTVRFGPQPHPGVLQAVLERAKGHPARDLIRHDLLRALKRARYLELPLGHYALSLRDYCHFTSPIRRYPDLTVHRMLKRLIDGRTDGNARLAGEARDIARESSERENAATQAERRADGIMTAAWMSRHIGEAFDGTVSNVTSWGLYVALENGAEGLVHIASMDDYYEFDQPRSRLVGSATGTVFRLGDRVRVRAESASVPLGEINFTLLPPDEESEGEERM